MSKIEKCANCERVIGKLEQAYLYKDKVVCLECNNSLNYIAVRKEALRTPTVVYEDSVSKKVVTIEKTSKGWKGFMLISWITLFCGFLFPPLFILGIILIIISSIGSWWCHG